METIVKGLTHTSEITVEEIRTARAMGSGDLPVLATPALAALAENAAMLAVADRLPEGSTTVGSRLELTHSRPTPVGGTVRATAVVTEVDGRRIAYAFRVEDEKGLVGEGTHERFVVDRERFMAKLK